ncbi:hypothetical protein [Neorhizobium sp. SOG26]|uniref:hypothetical protein n=1 Tax=Neorhizobium sp. SOG26 TaxID=2060726 RepID=UPI001FDEB552|nr:hypothetical protein [Neorhizobium sp. SOG26]
MLASSLTCALIAAGCGATAPASAPGLRRVVGTDLIGARGATPADERKIGRTVAGICAASIWTRDECRRHDEAVKP